MRKFKLIKEYPGSKALGTISQPNDSLQHDFFEKYSEYWQEIKEGNYQIMSFTASTSMWAKGTLATLQEDGTYSTNFGTNGWSLKEMLMVGNSVKNGVIQIHSVKRLSDGEIFTVGDRAKTITSKGSHDIRQFIIRQRCTGTDANGDYTYDSIDRIWIDWEKDCGGNWLDSTEKVHILGITEDGVEIKKGDVVYVVGRSLIDIDMISNFVPQDYPTKKAFSTLEAAENYIVENRYALSIKDFWEFASKPGCNALKSGILEKLVKQRLGMQ
jgi:hypothetical protein